MQENRFPLSKINRRKEFTWKLFVLHYGLHTSNLVYSYLRFSKNKNKKERERNLEGWCYKEGRVHFESGIKWDFKYHLDNSGGQEAKEMPCIVSSVTATTHRCSNLILRDLQAVISPLCASSAQRCLKTFQHGACSEQAAAQRSLADSGCLAQTLLTPDSSWWGK